MPMSAVNEYINSVPETWKQTFHSLLDLIRQNIPREFEEGIQYKMIGFFVPLQVYPKGYLNNPKEPLPFVSLASQKNYVSFYHLGLYSKEGLNEWFLENAEKEIGKKLNIGKSCIRFSKTSKIPEKTISELLQKISLNEWIRIYEHNVLERKRST